jgi:hypothetical protein
MVGDELSKQKTPFENHIIELVKQRQFDKAEKLIFAAVDQSPNSFVRLNSRITRLIMEGKPRDAAALVEQESPRTLSAMRPGPVPGIVPGTPIQHLLIHNGHHLMQCADAADIGSACGMPVVLADLLAPQAVNDLVPHALIILTGHTIPTEFAALRALKNSASDSSVVVWMFDNHHHYMSNVVTAAAADLCFPAHPMPADYLSFVAPGRIGPLVPLATVQWSRPELASLYRRFERESRSDALSGDYTFYHMAHRRNALLAQVMEHWPQARVSLNYEWSYHSQTPEERFLSWRRFKTSVCLPVAHDLSNRFFDALAAGQVPIVPGDILDLDRVIPPADQARLPVLRLKDYTVKALREAHKEAIAAFDRDGEEGAKRRHRYILEHHMIAHRISEILSHVRKHGCYG